MDIFSKNKFLYRVIIALIAINLFTVGFFWFARKDHADGHPPKKDFKAVSLILKEKLHLTDEQESNS